MDQLDQPVKRRYFNNKFTYNLTKFFGQIGNLWAFGKLLTVWQHSKDEVVKERIHSLIVTYYVKSNLPSKCIFISGIFGLLYYPVFLQEMYCGKPFETKLYISTEIENKENTEERNKI